MRILAVLVLAPALASCTSSPRAPASSCMQQTVDGLALAALANDRQHCVASGSIALRCGPVSAWMAGYGKEFGDLLGPGSFQRRDLRANAAGRRCAASVTSEAGLVGCCAAAGF